LKGVSAVRQHHCRCLRLRTRRRESNCADRPPACILRIASLRAYRRWPRRARCRRHWSSKHNALRQHLRGRIMGAHPLTTEDCGVEKHSQSAVVLGQQHPGHRSSSLGHLGREHWPTVATARSAHPPSRAPRQASPMPQRNPKSTRRRKGTLFP